jgi:nitrate/nitrite transporter NarK
MGMLTDRFRGRGVFSILMGLAAIVPWLVPLASSRTSSAAMCGISLMATESGR